MSSMVKFSSSSDNSNSHDDGHEQLDFLHPINSSTAAAANLSLSPDAFLGAATALKELVVEATWTEACAGGGEIVDPMFYTGLLGTAFTCLRFYEATGSHQDLQLSANIVRACATAVANSSTSRCTTFLCGRGGIYALGAVIANHSGDHHNRNFYLAEFLELAQERALPVGPKEGGFGMSYDLLHGRAGFLWAALFINKHIGQETVPSDLLNPIVQAVIAGGRTGASDQTLCPLMYRWHGTRYWGAAHGLAGILHVLLHFPLSEQDTEDVKKSLRYMMSKRFPHSGNYPSSEGKPRDNLVQWSHGAGGMALTLCKASQVFPEDREFRDGAIEAGEVVWKRGLSEKPGLSDGAAGNAYVFLALFRLTGDAIYEDRAKAFGGFLYRNVGKLINNANSHNPGHGFSLSEGLAGTACLWSDLFKPGDSRFPGFEI